MATFTQCIMHIIANTRHQKHKDLEPGHNDCAALAILMEQENVEARD
jgi:hypothetical protein